MTTWAEDLATAEDLVNHAIEVPDPEWRQVQLIEASTMAHIASVKIHAESLARNSGSGSTVLEFVDSLDPAQVKTLALNQATGLGIDPIDAFLAIVRQLAAQWR